MVKVRDVQPIMEHLLDRAEKAEKELEIYKKALKMMSEELSSTYDCDQGMIEICKICMLDVERMKMETCSDFLVQHYLRKAGKEE